MKATDRSVVFTHPMLARLAVILAKKPQDVARQKVTETRIGTQDSERRRDCSQLHATSAAVDSCPMTFFCSQLLDDDLQGLLPTAPGGRAVAAKAAADILPRVALCPHPDEVALFLLQPLHPTHGLQHPVDGSRVGRKAVDPWLSS